MEFNKDKWIKDGMIVNMPKKQKDKYELFVYLASICFDERKYTEKEINEILNSIKTGEKEKQQLKNSYVELLNEVKLFDEIFA